MSLTCLLHSCLFVAWLQQYSILIVSSALFLSFSSFPLPFCPCPFSTFLFLVFFRCSISKLDVAKPICAVEEAHESFIWDMAYHPMGHLLCTGSNDHTVKFWCRGRPGDTINDRSGVEKSCCNLLYPPSRKERALIIMTLLLCISLTSMHLPCVSFFAAFSNYFLLSDGVITVFIISFSF